MTSIVLLGPALRVDDNPALHAAIRHAASTDSVVVAVYVASAAPGSDSPAQRAPGGAFEWWTRRSVPLLTQELDDLHVPLVCVRADTPDIAAAIVDLHESSGGSDDKDSTAGKDGAAGKNDSVPTDFAVFANRQWGGQEHARDERFAHALHDAGIDLHGFSAHVLHHPWKLQTGQGEAYKVFTSFSKRFFQAQPTVDSQDWFNTDLYETTQYDANAQGTNTPADTSAVQAAADLPTLTANAPFTAAAKQLAGALEKHGATLLDWQATPQSSPDWAEGFDWEPGTAAARQILADFIDDDLAGYPEGRDLPALDATSRLSPYLAHGEISAHEVWNRTNQVLADGRVSEARSSAAKVFATEVLWRDFNYHLLYAKPDLATANWNPKFDAFDWSDPHATGDEGSEITAALAAWRAGLTGFPIIDAGMRQLWHTGWMHNRVRMVVASFVAKNIRTHWSHGEEWFWDTLVDADPANNPGNWQWASGTGADAAPYFRIFNPTRQAERFDKHGDYVRRWLPELRGTSDKDLMKLYERTPDLPQPADLPKRPHLQSEYTEDMDYPAPILALKESRGQALAAFKGI